MPSIYLKRGNFFTETPFFSFFYFGKKRGMLAIPRLTGSLVAFGKAVVKTEQPEALNSKELDTRQPKRILLGRGQQNALNLRLHLQAAHQRGHYVGRAIGVFARRQEAGNGVQVVAHGHKWRLNRSVFPCLRMANVGHQGVAKALAPNRILNLAALGEVVRHRLSRAPITD
jgi:hypothetical protein